jgi:WD40 repeat protein/tRNA A-37 threonylcarbamoyl transferase component Bud32
MFPTHPGADRLMAFARGELDESELDPVAIHLDGCPDCREAVDALAADDPFLGRLGLAARSVGRLVTAAGPRREAALALAADTRRHLVPEDDAPRDVGHYELIEEAGRGGMGVVYKARHRGLNRLVALKMILAGEFASGAQLARFRLEAELAARVRHPHIVQIYEVGTHAGRPYLAMEWVEGGTLAQYLDGRPVPESEAARLVEKLARAVAAAHRQGIVHRDLKPENILLETAPAASGPFDPAPKIADFGLARPLQDAAGLTTSGLMVGTPEYLAPELAEGKGEAAGPLTDVYSLGIILYQLLTGAPPFRGDGPAAVLRAAAGPPMPPRRICRHLPRDLETVVLKAIERDPSRRYPGADALADDLRRFFEGQPIQARPVGTRVRLMKWARREPRLACLAAVLAVVSVASFAGMTSLWVSAASALSVARDRGDAERRARYRAGVAAASAALQFNNVAAARRLLVASPPEYRRWEWQHLASLLDNSRSALRPHERPDRPTSLCLSPDGTRGASIGSGGRNALLWSTGPGVSPTVSLIGHDAPILALAYSADGTRIATSSVDRTVRTWDDRTGSPLAVFRGHDGPVEHLIFSPDGTRIASRTATGLIVWDLARSSSIVHLGEESRFHGNLIFSPDGRRIAAASDDTIRLWEVETGLALPILTGRGRSVLCYSFSPDGTRIATGSVFPDLAVRIHDLKTGTVIAELKGHKNSIEWVGYSPDGRVLVSASRDQTLRVWDAADGRPGPILRGHTNLIRIARFLGPGRIVSSALDNTLRVWDLENGEVLGVLRGPVEPLVATSGSRNSTLIATADADGLVQFWDPEATARGGVLSGHRGFVYDVAFSPDGRRVASASWDGTARVWDATTGRQLSELRHEGSLVMGVAYRADGGELATAAREGRTSTATGEVRVRLWDPDTGRVRDTLSFPAPSDSTPRLSYGPSGGLLSVNDESVHPFAPVAGRSADQFRGEGRIFQVAYSPDGTRVATLEGGRIVRIRPINGGHSTAVALTHDEKVNRFAYRGDGRMIATGSAGGRIRLWDEATGRLLAILEGGSSVYGLAFHPDGNRLAVGHADGVIRLWDVDRFEDVGELQGHEGFVHALAFSPDGTRLVSASGDFTLRVWDTLTRRDRLQAFPQGDR